MNTNLLIARLQKMFFQGEKQVKKAKDDKKVAMAIATKVLCLPAACTIELQALRSIFNQ